MRLTIQRALVIVMASAALGLIANAVSPRGIPLITPPAPPLAESDKIPLAEAEQLWNAGTAFFLDARSPADFAAGHIANAHNLPVEQFDEFLPQVESFLTKDATIIAYCDGEECTLSHELTDRLRTLGYTHVWLLHNGWTEWRKAGLPIQ